MGFIDCSAYLGGGVTALFTDRHPVDGIKPDFRVSRSPKVPFGQLAKRMDVLVDQLLFLKQVHGNVVHHIKKDRCWTQLQPLAEGDGLITDRLDVCLVTFHGDCTPVYFYDPASGAIGLCHSGWKGTALGVVEKMMEAMERAFSSRPENLRVYIGPAAGGCCYEVDEPVISAMKAPSLEGALTKVDQTHYLLDTKRVNENLLLQGGVLSKHIAVSPACTLCDHRFFSHRRAPGEGLMVAALRTHGPSESRD